MHHNCRKTCCFKQTCRLCCQREVTRYRTQDSVVNTSIECHFDLLYSGWLGIVYATISCKLASKPFYHALSEQIANPSSGRDHILRYLETTIHRSCGVGTQTAPDEDHSPQFNHCSDSVCENQNTVHHTIIELPEEAGLSTCDHPFPQ